MIHSGELQEETDGLRTYDANLTPKKGGIFCELTSMHFVYIYVTSSLTILSITLMMNYDYIQLWLFHLGHYYHTLFIIVFMIVMRYNQAI